MNLLRLDVLSDLHEHRVAQPPVVGPLGERRFADERRLDPLRQSLRSLQDRRIERALPLREPVEPFAQLDREGVREAGADAPGEDQPRLS